MTMTDEMIKWDKAFQTYLAEIDKKYTEYFNSDQIAVSSITGCFATLNGANLRAVPRNLRQEIYNEVIEKLKEIWGKWHHFAVI